MPNARSRERTATCARPSPWMDTCIMKAKAGCLPRSLVLELTLTMLMSLGLGFVFQVGCNSIASRSGSKPQSMA
eukprot:9493666-Pyramimonas_sp.AAC.1